MSLRATPVLHVRGLYAKRTTIPPPPWQKVREYQHLQKFKEFNLGEFPWVHSHFSMHGKAGGWVWGDAKQMQADRLLKESRHTSPRARRYPHPDLPAQQDRLEVPQAAAAVIASHVRGRPGGYGVSPEQLNVPLTVHSERPEFDTAKKDQPRTARMRWAQYREVEVVVAVEALGLTKHARRRLEAAFCEYLHEGTLHITCDNYEDFWDNYEWAATKLNQMVADAKKADLHPSYRPMEQYKVREGAHEHVSDSLRDWFTLQAQSITLGEKYKALKETGAESVTGFNLYETPAYAVYNAEKAARKRIQVKLEGVEQGYAVDKMSQAMYQASSALHKLEEEEIPEDLAAELVQHEAATGAGSSEPRQLSATESADFQSEMSSAFADMGAADEDDAAPPAEDAQERRQSGPAHARNKPAAAASEEDDDFSDLLSDFVNPDDE